MKTFHFNVTAELDGSGVEFAIEQMSNASRSFPGDSTGTVIVAVMTDQDLQDSIARQLMIKQEVERGNTARQQLLNFVLAVTKVAGGRLRLTQSQLNEIEGWTFKAEVDEKAGIVTLVATPKKGSILTLN